MAVRLLCDLEVAQYPSRFVAGADGDECRTRFDQIARPDQMIPAQIVVTLGEAPRNGEAGNDAALDMLRFVGAQDGGAQVVQHTTGWVP